MTNYTIEAQKALSDALVDRWRCLLEAGSSPRKIDQSPEFFRFLGKSNDSYELLSISGQKTDEIVGVVPLRFRKQSIEFGLKGKILLAPRIDVIEVLGSIPLVTCSSAYTKLLEHIFLRYPRYDALSFSTLPAESGFYASLNNFVRANPSYGIHVLHGWRDCHVIPLPSSFEEYLRGFNSKKRFNLNRQIRLLREHVGEELVLKKIERPDHVSHFIESRNRIAEPIDNQRSLSKASFTKLAECDLLNCYILTAGEQPIGVVDCTRSKDTAHIHKILYRKDLGHFSVGTSILNLVIEDLIKNSNCTQIDLGFSNPVHSHKSSNVVQKRGHLLLFKKKVRTELLLFAQKRFDQFSTLFKAKLSTGKRVR